MNILQVLYYYTPHCSGVTIYAERLARHLTARGHQVTILAARHDRGYPPDETVDGVRVVRVPAPIAISRGVIMPTFLPTAARLARGADVVHLHLPALEAAPLALIARALRTRLILTHHTDLTLTGGAVNKLAERAVFHSGVAAGRLADRVVTYTHDRASVSPTMTRLAGRTSVVYPPIEIAPPSAGAATSFRAHHGLADAPIVGFAGRFAEEKGCDDLLRTIPAVRAAVPGAIYAFAGEYRDVLGETLYERTRPLLAEHADHVRMLGVLRGQALSDFYAACDVLVLPSVNFTETFGLVQVEAMLCGTPVVASDLPGVREAVRVTGMGRIAPPRQPEHLAAAIVEVITNRAAYRRPRAEIAARFSIDATVDAYERLYRGEAPGSAPADAPNGNHRASDGGAAPAADRTAAARAAVRRLLPAEADLGFRRRCETILELLACGPGDRVLDCGCGYGFTLSTLLHLTDTGLVGVDPAADRLAFARSQLGDDPRLSLVLGDARALPFPDASFSHVVCSEVLEHVDDDAAALAEISRVLRPGGCLVVTVPSADYPMAWDPVNFWLERLAGRHLGGERPWSGIWHGHRRLYSPTDLRRLVEAAGLQVVTERSLTQHTFPFAHLVLYGTLKPLLQRGFVPGAQASAAGRFSDGTTPSPSGLVRLPLALLARFDRRNDDDARVARATRSLALALKAVKPG